MHYRSLGDTGIQISAIAFGAGPISTLMVGSDSGRQRAVVKHALDAGINWFDTAATYGDGQSELSLGQALAALGAADQVHVATKVRVMPADLGDIRGAVRRSFQASLQRLGLRRVTLLQLHNSITERRGDEPTSLTPEDVLGRDGILTSFQELQSQGLVRHLGITGIGQPAALREVIRSAMFQTLQVPYHLLNPSAGRRMSNSWPETDYGNIIQDCADLGLGVLAIRVLAGGALAENPPSPHTLKTPFFPLALYERDLARARRIREWLGPNHRLPTEAIRFALAHPHIHSAIIGFGETEQVDQAVEAVSSAPLVDFPPNLC